MIKPLHFPRCSGKRAYRLLLTLSLLLFSFCANAQKVEFKSLSNDDFARQIADSVVQLVDVRTPQEFYDKRIPGAVNINLQDDDFETEIRKLDIKRPVALYCRSGARSKMAARQLAQWGYTVCELNGGLMNWNGKTE